MWKWLRQTQAWLELIKFALSMQDVATSAQFQLEVGLTFRALPGLIMLKADHRRRSRSFSYHPATHKIWGYIGGGHRWQLHLNLCDDGCLTMVKDFKLGLKIARRPEFLTDHHHHHHHHHHHFQSCSFIFNHVHSFSPWICTKVSSHLKVILPHVSPVLSSSSHSVRRVRHGVPSLRWHSALTPGYRQVDLVHRRTNKMLHHIDNDNDNDTIIILL